MTKAVESWMGESKPPSLHHFFNVDVCETCCITNNIYTYRHHLKLNMILFWFCIRDKEQDNISLTRLKNKQRASYVICNIIKNI